MEADHRKHFAHPEHPLLKTHYDSKSTKICDICHAKLSGLVGYRCNDCDFDIHEACADYFKETVSFFAHPWHTLTLSRIPDGTIKWSCNICRESCPPGMLVYRCIKCNFDVHPLCTLLPQTIRSPLHPKHDLNMVPGSGRCSGCCKDLNIWHYRCGFCLYKSHIGCAVSGTPPISAQNTTAVGQNRITSVAKFLLKTSFVIAINAATDGRALPVLNVLEAALVD
uniref:Phorbol-ester/DAG-type domain-containing protein n=1 Tax=Leersia perrieri TaxID=77586 RepID=A0A0D9X1D7_9ORYZ